MTKDTDKLALIKKVERFVINGSTVERAESWVNGPFWYELSESGARTSLDGETCTELEEQYWDVKTTWFTEL